MASMEYSYDGIGEIHGISAIVQEESSYLTILQSHDPLPESQTQTITTLDRNSGRHSSESRRIMNPADLQFISSILGEWRPISCENVGRYMAARDFSEEQKSIFENSHLHFELNGEMLLTYQRHMGHSHHSITTEFERAFVRNGVCRTFFVEDNCMHTIAMDLSVENVVCREKKFVKNGYLHVIRKRDGLECTRVYERVGRHVKREIDGLDVQNPTESRDNQLLEEMAEIKETLNDWKHQNHLEIKGSLDKLLSEVADIKKRVENTDNMGAKIVANLSPVRIEARQEIREETRQLAVRGSRGVAPLGLTQSDTTESESYDQTLEPNPMEQDPPCIKVLPVSLEELLLGTVKPVSLERKIYSNSRNPRIEVRILRVPIKPGAVAGTKIVFARAGDEYPNRIPGDLILILSDQPHAKFSRDGADLGRIERISSLPTTLRFMVPTLDGPCYPVMWDDIARTGGVVRLHGLGLPYPNTMLRGDMIVTFIVDRANFLDI